MILSEALIVHTGQLFSSAVLFLTIYLVLRKSWRNVVDGHFRRRQRFFEPRVVLFLCQDSGGQTLTDLRPRWAGDEAVVRRLLVEGAENISGEMAGRLREAFERLGYVASTLQRLRSRRWWIRAEAAYHLGLMKSSMAVEGLRRGLSDPVPEVMLVASRSLASIQGPQAFKEILSHFKDFSRWASMEVAEIFFEMGPAVAPQLVESLEILPPEAQRLVIEVLGYLRDPNSYQPLVKYLQSPDLEVRARTVKALGAFADPRSMTDLIPLLQDPAWQVRLLSCGALGRFEHPYVSAAIALRLVDPDMRVRIRAAETLYGLGDKGQIVLREAYDRLALPARPWLKQFMAALLLAFSFCMAPLCGHADQAQMDPSSPQQAMTSTTPNLLDEIVKELSVYRSQTQEHLLMDERLGSLEAIFPTLVYYYRRDPSNHDSLAQAQNAEREYYVMKTAGAKSKDRLDYLARILEINLEKILRSSSGAVPSNKTNLYQDWSNETWTHLHTLERNGATPEERIDYLYQLLQKTHVWTAANNVVVPSGWGSWVPPALRHLAAPMAYSPTYQVFEKGVNVWLAYRREGHLPLFLQRFLYFYDHTVLVYFALLNMIYVLLFIISYVSITRYLRVARVSFSRNLLHSPMTLPISVLVPAYNEENVLVESVRSFLSVQYRQFEVIVINDGSRDRTMDRLQVAFDLRRSKRPNPGLLASASIRGIFESPRYPNLLVIDKENGGKSDALNAGINFARYPLFCCVDADSILEPEALLRVVKPFMHDPQIVAVGGVVRIANGNKIRGGFVERIRLPGHALPLFQIVEYLRAFFSGRMGWSALQGLLLISGAFGLFKKDVVLRCGGYRTDTVGEDMDLVVRMHRQLREEGTPYRMIFIPDPICWTEAPESLKVLSSQRDRWQRGLAQTLVANHAMIFNRRYGVVGLLAIPYYVLFEMIGPVIEFGGYIAVLLSILLLPVDLRFIELFFFAAILFGALLSVGAVLLEEMSFHRYPRVRHLLVLVIVAFAENFGYRQLNAWWRCKGLFRAFSKEVAWGTMTRKGYGAA